LKSFIQNQKFKLISWWIIVIAFFIGLTSSNALLSVSIGVLLAHTLFFNKLNDIWLRLKKNMLFWFIFLLFFVYLAGMFISSDINSWLKDIIKKLPWLIIPLALVKNENNSNSSNLLLLSIFNTFIIIIGILSFINYFIDYHYYNQRIFEAKPIPVISGLNHIYYSMMLAFSALVSFTMIVGRQAEYQRWISVKTFKWINTVYFLVFLIFLHTISARTGLVAFYLSFLVLSMIIMLKHYNIVFSLLLIIIIVMIGFLSVKYIPILNNRYEKTLEDITVYKEKGDINYYSFSTRMEYWKACLEMFTENPVLGVGNPDVQPELNQYLVKNYPILDQKNRLNPHNQYLHMLCGTGLIGFMIFIIILVFMFINAKKRNDYFILSLLFVCSVCFFVESILERQAGIAFFLFFSFVMFFEKKSEGGSASHEFSNVQQ